MGDQGHGAYADVYGTQTNDFPVGRVALCVTDLGRGRELVKAAAKADPGADPTLVDLYVSRYAHRELVKVISNVFAKKFTLKRVECALWPRQRRSRGRVGDLATGTFGTSAAALCHSAAAIQLCNCSVVVEGSATSTASWSSGELSVVMAGQR